MRRLSARSARRARGDALPLTERFDPISANVDEALCDEVLCDAWSRAGEIAEKKHLSLDLRFALTGILLGGWLRGQPSLSEDEALLCTRFAAHRLATLGKVSMEEVLETFADDDYFRDLQELCSRAPSFTSFTM